MYNVCLQQSINMVLKGPQHDITCNSTNNNNKATQPYIVTWVRFCVKVIRCKFRVHNKPRCVMTTCIGLFPVPLIIMKSNWQRDLQTQNVSMYVNIKCMNIASWYCICVSAVVALVVENTSRLGQ